MQKTPPLSGLGRPLDSRYPTNRAIPIIMAVGTLVMFVFQLVTGTSLVQAGIQAILAGLTIFFTWAFTREIDPEEQLSAFLSVFLITIALFTLNITYNLLLIFYLMTLSRMLNRSIGIPFTMLDSIICLLLTGFVGYFFGWIYVLPAVSAFLLDGILPDANKKHRVVAVIALILMIITFTIQDNPLNPILPSMQFTIVIVLSGLIFLHVIWKSRELTVVADIGKEALRPIRVQATQLLALFSLYFVAFWQGDDGITSLLPLLATILAVGLFPLIKPFLPEINLEKDDSKK